MGYHWIACTVVDAVGASATDSVGVVVGHRVGDYPFDGNPLDRSGFKNDATEFGAVLVGDRFGNPSSAYRFDGVDDMLQISSHPSLDFRDEIGLSLWIQPTQILSRESFLISHGSWQNRWKVSVTPEKRIRWTVRTESGVKDLDSRAIVVQDSVFHLALTFGQGAMRIYINGELDAETDWTGRLLETSLDLTIGQMLPGDAEYNFEGVIDDVLIQNTILSEEEVRALYGGSTAVEDVESIARGQFMAFPNPFGRSVMLEFETAKAGPVLIRVYDISGRLVRTVLSGELPAGLHRQSWDGRDAQGLVSSSGVYVVRLEYEGRVRHSKVVRVADGAGR